MSSKKVTTKHLREAVRVLAGYAAKHRGLLILLSVLSVISALGNALVPFIAGRLFDSILAPEQVVLKAPFRVTLPWALLAVWGVIQLVTYIIDWRLNIAQMRLGARVFFDYFSQGFSHLLELPLSFHKKKKIGSVANKINIAANDLEALFGRVLVELVPQFLSIAVAVGISFWIEPVLALVLITGVLLYVLAMTQVVKPIAGILRKLHRQFSNSFGDAYDVVMNAQPVKQATAESQEQHKIHQRFSVRNYNLWTKLQGTWVHLTFLQRIIVLLTQLTVFSFSIIFIINGRMSIGELFALNSYAALIFAPFLQLGRQWERIMSGLINVYEAEQVMRHPTERYRPKNDQTPPSFSGRVDFESVDFYYHQAKPVLSGISFTAAPGQTVALVGESGVGKTTLVDMISGFHYPKKGAVRVDGVNIRNLDLTKLRENIAVVSQEVVLFNDSIKRNIQYGDPRADIAQVKEAARQANILADIENFPKQWNQIVGERGIKLSVGQKQRVAIARAILRDPNILILDEPTSALDARAERRIQRALEKLMRDRTTFIVAHRLSTVRHADLILVLKGGRIVESGDHQALLRKKGEYFRLYEMQFGETGEGVGTG